MMTSSSPSRASDNSSGDSTDRDAGDVSDDMDARDRTSDGDGSASSNTNRDPEARDSADIDLPSVDLPELDLPHDSIDRITRLITQSLAVSATALSLRMSGGMRVISHAGNLPCRDSSIAARGVRCL